MADSSSSTTTAPAEKPRVAFLGPPASFTHQATITAFAEATHALVPVETIRAVFDAVQTGAAAYGVVPLENSTHGVVTFTLDALADRTRSLEDLRVCGEVYLDVHHFLLGYRHPSSQQEFGHIRRVLSHPQAFGQTAAFFAANLAGVDTVDVSSTSRAAETAAADRSGATAAVAGEMAAGVYGLDVLARCIEDRADNTTRFVVLRRGDDDSVSPPPRSSGDGEKKKKSLLSFTVPHESPGALADVLDVFRTYGLNLTSISSVPSLVRPFQYLFFVEFEGSRETGRVQGALGRIGSVAEGWRWWGSWESQR